MSPAYRTADHLESPRVLLVNGDYDACDRLADLLRADGFEVDVAYDGQSAMELVCGQQYAVAVLDHWPPFLDAVGLWHRLRRLAGGPTLLLRGTEPGEWDATGRSPVTSFEQIAAQIRTLLSARLTAIPAVAAC